MSYEINELPENRTTKFMSYERRELWNKWNEYIKRNMIKIGRK